MNTSRWIVAIAMVLSSFAGSAVAQSNVPFEAYVYGQPKQSAPYTSSMCVTGVPSSSAYTTKCLPADNFASITGPQTLSQTTLTSPIINGPISGNYTLTGTVTLPPTGVTPGSYQNANVTVTSDGRISAIAPGSGSITGMISGQIPVANTPGSIAASIAISGDCTLNTSSGAITCTKTGGQAFQPSATTDTTNAVNITSGTLPAARLPTVANGAFLGYGAGSGQGNAQPVAIVAGSNVTFPCSFQTCTINATGGISGPNVSVVNDVAAYNSVNGNILLDTGIPSGTLAIAGAPLTLNQLLVGSGGQRTAVLGTSGAVNTVLHGNPSGAPSFAAVNLSTDITGNLPVTNLNGGTNATGSTFWSGNGTWQPAPSGAFGTLASGTNTIASMVVGSGASLTSSGGPIVATSMPASGLSGASLPATITGSSLTSLGLVTSGTWQATQIGVSYGGTGANLLSTGGSNQVVQQLTQGGPFTVAQLNASNLSNGTTGSGPIVLQSGANLTNSNLGTPLTLNLANATNLPLATGISGLGAGVAAVLATPTSSSGSLLTSGGNLGTPSAANLVNATGLPLSTGVTGVLQAAQFPALTGAVTTSPGNLATSFEIVSNAQFLGYGAGSGSGSAQAVTIQAGTGASFVCVAQTCTIGATGTGGVSGPGSSTTNYVPQWASTAGNALGAGLPVATTPTPNALVMTGPSGTIANGFHAAGSAAANIGTLGGALSGTLPNPSLAAGAAAANVGAISGDISGSLPSLTVVGLQGKSIATTAPTLGQILGWNGSVWTPTNAPISGINALTQDVSASGTGSQPATVVGLQTRAVSSTAPTNGQILGWNGTAWGPTNAPLSALTQDVTASGTGSQPATVVGLQTRPIATTAPTTGQLLGWGGASWGPVNPGLSALTQDVVASGIGSRPATVVALQNNPVSSTAPTSGQILGWNGSTWTPLNAPISGINALTQDVTAAGTGSQPATVIGLQNRAVASTAPSNGQLLGWNSTSTSWGPVNPPVTGITALTGPVTASGSGSQASTITPTGVTAGSYTITAQAAGVYDCMTIAASGQITALTAGACGGATYLLINGGGKLLLNGGGSTLTNGS